jgi:putative PIN family toxin of toxin-antitoxin system
MKIVLDTNVFISGIFFRGPPSQILQAWKNKKLRIILSQVIFDEYHRNWGSSLRLTLGKKH